MRLGTLVLVSAALVAGPALPADLDVVSGRRLVLEETRGEVLVGEMVVRCRYRRAPTNAPDDPSYVGSAYGLARPSYYGMPPPLGVDILAGRSRGVADGRRRRAQEARSISLSRTARSLPFDLMR